MDANGKEGMFFDMKQIKTKRNALLTSGKLFSDKEFPTEIGIEALNDNYICWKRIKDFDDGAQQYMAGSQVEGEIEQGLLGDNNVVAAISAISNHPKLLNYIFPPGQNFNESTDYCGLFYFRFWRMGKWEYVVVDDKVPIIAGKKGEEQKRKPDKGKGKAVDGKKNEKDDKRSEGAPEDSAKDLKGSTELATLDEQPERSQKDEMGVVSKPKNEAEVVVDTSKNPNDTQGKDGKVQETEMKNSGNSSGNKHTELEKDQMADEDGQVSSKPKVDESVSSTKHLEDEKNKVNDSKQSAIKTQELAQKGSTTTRSSKKEAGEGDSEKVTPNKGNKTIFVRVFGADGKQFYWATLLEKAYAKVCGGYHELCNADIFETLLDMTGGITETFYANHLQRNFFLNIKNWSDNHAIILAATSLDKDTDPPAGKTPSVKFFTVTRVFLADFRKLLGRDKILGFVRLLNPNGKLKFDDKWAEAIEEWKILPPLVKGKLNMEIRGEGEFYLTYNNFLRAFSTIIVCCVADGDNYNCEGYINQWIKPRIRYNLCKIDELRFHQFPQHKIWVRDPNSKDTITDVVISLVQDGRCCCSDSPSYNVMQFFLFCLEEDRTYPLPLDFDFFRYNRPIGCSNISSQKEVTSCFNLYPGFYLVVPVVDFSNIVHPCLSNGYLLRVVTYAKFPKAPEPPLSTFSDSENLNIYFDLAETIEIEPKAVLPEGSSEPAAQDADKTAVKEKGRGKKKKVKH